MSSLQYSVIADVSNTELNLKFHSYQLIINWKLLSSEIMPKNLNFKNSFQVEIPILEFFSLNIKDSHSLQRYLIHRLSISSWNILKFWYEIYICGDDYFYIMAYTSSSSYVWWDIRITKISNPIIFNLFDRILNYLMTKMKYFAIMTRPPNLIDCWNHKIHISSISDYEVI